MEDPQIIYVKIDITDSLLTGFYEVCKTQYMRIVKSLQVAHNQKQL